MAAISSHGMLQDLSAASMIWAPRWYADRAGAGIPLDEAPETTESAEPCGTAGAITPGTGTLAGASIAFAGTFVPSGRALCLASALLAAALELTRLAVQAPESSASGRSTIDF